MGAMTEMFREGGLGMYVILAGGLPAWVFAVACIAGLMKRHAKTMFVAGGLSLLTGLFPIIAGIAFYFMGMGQVEEALQAASPQMQERLREVGEHAARLPLYFGLALGSVPTLIGPIALIMGITARNAR